MKIAAPLTGAALVAGVVATILLIRRAKRLSVEPTR